MRGDTTWPPLSQKILKITAHRTIITSGKKPSNIFL